MSEVMAVIWSLFVMYLLVRYLNHRKFQKDMDRALREAAVLVMEPHAEALVIRLFEATVKNYLLESKVVGQTVQFRWSNKERVDAVN